MPTQQDVFAEQEALKRRRALMDAMQQQNMQGQITGNTGLGQALAKLGTAYVLKNGQNKVDAESVANRDRYNTELASGLQTYLNQRNGTPEGTMSDQQANDLMNNDQAPELTPAQPGDPRKAVMGAMTSKFPELQNLGKAEFAQLGKQENDYKEHVTQDGTIVRTYANGRTQNMGNFAKPKDKFTDPYSIQGPSGPILVKRNLATNEVEPVDKGVKVTTNVDTKGKGEFAKKMGEIQAKTIDDSYQKAKSASAAIDAIGNAEQDVQSGIKSGITANVNLGLAKLGKAFGLGDDPAIAGTESFRANMARETLNLVKGLGAGTSISNADRDFAEKASGGSITLDDQAIVRLMKIAKTAAANVLLSHNRLLGKAKTANPDMADELDVMDVPLTVDGDIDYDATSKKFLVGGSPMAGTPAPVKATPKNAPQDPRITWDAMRKGSR